MESEKETLLLPVQTRFERGGADGLRPLERRFESMGEVGRGATATVVRTRDHGLRRTVAVKRLQGDRNQSRMKRFLAEAQITAQLEHPGIVPIYDLEWSDDGGVSYSMKLIEGESFDVLMRRSSETRGLASTPPADVRRTRLLEYFQRVCEAVHYAHAKGVVHRDLKPANIMIGGHHEVYVVDWGLAKLLSAGEGEDQPLDPSADAKEGGIYGTPAYMAPEQAMGQTDLIGPYTDQYALGLILAEIVNGGAFRPLGGQKALISARKAELPRLSPVRRTERVDAGLQAIVNRAAGRFPEDRYESVGALAKDLRRWMQDEPIEALPDGPLRRAQRWLARNADWGIRIGLVLATLLMALITVGLAWLEVLTVRSAAREHALTSFVAQVGGHTNRLDQKLAQIEAQVEGKLIADVWCGTELDLCLWRHRGRQRQSTKTS